MKIGLQTWGTDGDILPFFAFANGLRSAGHDVTVCYTSIDGTDYSYLAEKLDVKSINVFPTPKNDIHVVGKEVTKTPNLLKQCLLVFGKFFEPVIEEMYEASKHLCRENDIVIGHYVQHTLYTAAEKYDIPRVSVCLLPSAISSRYYPPLGSPDLGSFVNSLQHFLADKIGPRFMFPSLNKLQSREGLPGVKRYSKQIIESKYLTLVPVSPSLFPSKPDWDKNIHTCGFFNIPTCKDIWNIPAKLQDFINADDPPIYVTLGSMDRFQPEENFRLLIEAIRLTKQRAIIQTTVNRASHPTEDPNVFIVNKIPHHAVFSLCSAVVHHGGAGTTQSSLLAGRASLVVEHVLDQTFWAQQLKNVGVAEKMLHRRSVSPQQLADAINTILDSPKYKENARNIGTMMRKENGVNTAVQLIEKKFQIC